MDDESLIDSNEKSKETSKNESQSSEKESKVMKVTV